MFCLRSPFITQTNFMINPVGLKLWYVMSLQIVDKKDVEQIIIINVHYLHFISFQWRKQKMSLLMQNYFENAVSEICLYRLHINNFGYILDAWIFERIIIILWCCVLCIMCCAWLVPLLSFQMNAAAQNTKLKYENIEEFLRFEIWNFNESKGRTFWNARFKISWKWIMLGCLLLTKLYK